MKKNHFQCGVTTKNIIISYIVSLMPLLLYGLYKNFIVVYNRGLIKINDIFSEIIIILSTILIAVVSDYLYCKIKRTKFKEYITKSFSIVFAMLLFLSLPPMFNKTIYFGALIILLTIIKIIPYNILTINTISLIKIAIISTIFIKNDLNYANIYEQTKNISYTLYNSFFGKTIGGFGTTNIFLICVSYIYLSTRIHYKKEIPLYSLTTYIITGIIYLLITKSNISNITNEIITTNILFALVYIATIPHYSTATKEGTIIYSILTGILAYIFMHKISIFEGAFLAIIVTSSLSKIIDLIILRIKNRQKIIK